MNGEATWGRAGLAVVLMILAASCSTSPVGYTHPESSPQATAHSRGTGCAGTVVTDAVPPAWAQVGWTVDSRTIWPVPWALGTQGDSLAFVFASQLVAGTSPRTDGSQNKVLWEVRDSPSGANVMVVGHPLGRSLPVVSIAGGPSITDVPTPGCWTFQLTWSSGGVHNSTINLEVLPAGSLPT